MHVFSWFSSKAVVLRTKFLQFGLFHVFETLSYVKHFNSYKMYVFLHTLKLESDFAARWVAMHGKKLSPIESDNNEEIENIGSSRT